MMDLGLETSVKDISTMNPCLLLYKVTAKATFLFASSYLGRVFVLSIANIPMLQNALLFPTLAVVWALTFFISFSVYVNISYKNTFYPKSFQN